MTLDLLFRMKQDRKSIFQEVGGLAMKNIFVFCLQRVELYFKDMPNSIGFYTGIFSHVIPICLWFHGETDIFNSK